MANTNLLRRPGKVLNQDVQLERRAEAARRPGATIYDFPSSIACSPVQLRAFDREIGNLHGAVAVANHDLYGDPLPAGVAVQRRGGEDSARVHAAAERGVRGGGGRLPYAERIQAAFGAHDVSGISSHVGGAASEACDDMGASAYATGSSVAFRGAPDLHTAAHEAAHIVQQRAGVSLKGGVGAAGDRYERHADRVADLVVRGQSAEQVLNEMVGGGRGGGVQQKRGVQRKDDKGAAGKQAKDKVTSKVGADTAIDANLTIPLWGPVKFVGKVAGTFTQNQGTGKGASSSSEVEVSVYGGLIADFVFASLSVGVKGRLKVEVAPTSDPLAALKAGIGDVLRWETARNFSAKVQAARKSIDKARGEAKAAFKSVIDDALARGLLPDFALHSHVLNYANALQSALRSIGAKRLDDKAIFAKITAHLNPIYQLQSQFPRAPADQKKNIDERKVRIKALGVALTKLVDDSCAAINGTFAQASGPGNDPKVGFEAAISFEVGANVVAGPNLSAEVQLIVAAGIEDKKGATAWNHGVSQSKAIAATFTTGGFQVMIGGSLKDDDEVEVTFGFTKSNATFGAEPPETHATEIATFARQAFGFAKMRELFGPTRTSAAQATAKAVAGFLGAKMRVPPKGSAAGARSSSVEIKLKGSIKQGKVTEGSVKIVLQATQLGASSPIKKAMVGGSVRSGQFIEVKIERQ